MITRATAPAAIHVGLIPVDLLILAVIKALPSGPASTLPGSSPVARATAGPGSPRAAPPSACGATPAAAPSCLPARPRARPTAPLATGPRPARTGLRPADTSLASPSPTSTSLAAPGAALAPSLPGGACLPALASGHAPHLAASLTGDPSPLPRLSTDASLSADSGPSTHAGLARAAAGAPPLTARRSRPCGPSRPRDLLEPGEVGPHHLGAATESNETEHHAKPPVKHCRRNCTGPWVRRQPP